MALKGTLVKKLRELAYQRNPVLVEYYLEPGITPELAAPAAQDVLDHLLSKRNTFVCHEEECI